MILQRLGVSRSVVYKITAVLLFVFLSGILFASESSDGYIRLILNQRNGSFSLFYLTDPVRMRYEPLLYNKDPTSSFLSVMEDGYVHMMGKSREFRTRLERQSGHPALVFESSSLLVAQVFTPVKTPNSPNVNGVRIDVTVQNKGTRHSFIGVRMLFDTYLGEQRGRIPFITNTQIIRSEKIIESLQGELFWISQGENVSLMGSVVNPVDSEARLPDYIHFANWKRLSDAAWDLNYSEGRSFNYAPYSVGDSAVCYFYEPVLLESRGMLTFTVFLTTDDIAWYRKSHPMITVRIPDPVPEQPSVPPAIIVPSGTVPVTVTPETQVEEVVLIEPEPYFIEPEIVPEPELVMEPEPVEEEPEPIPVSVQITVIEEPVVETEELKELYDLQETLNKFLNGELFLSESDLLEIERSINAIRSGQ